MASRQVVHSIAALLTCGWILLSNSMLCVAAPSCDGAIFLRTEGPYKYGQEVAVRVIISPESHYPNSDVEVFSVPDDDRYRLYAKDLGDGVWDATIRIPLLYNWNRKIGFRLWQGMKLVCEKTKTVDMKADMVMDIKGPEWSCAGYPAEYELTMGGAPSPLSVHWDFGQEERNITVNTQGRVVQRIRWKTPGEKSVTATIRAQAHPLQSRMISTRVVPKNRGLVVQGPQTVQQGKLEDWTIVGPPIGPQHMTYRMVLEVDWGQGETSRYVDSYSWFRIRKRFARPGTYTVGLRLLERNTSTLLENKFIVKVIEDRPTLDLQVTGPQQVTAGTPAFWTARTTRGRPPYEFWVRRWDSGEVRKLSSESNVGKFSLNLSTPGKNRLTFQVVDADGIGSDWREINVLVIPEKNEVTVENGTQGGVTTTTGGTIKKDPPPDSGQQNGSGSGATPVGDQTGSPERYGGLVIKGPARISVKASAHLKALDHGGRAYVSATWVSSNTEVLRVSADGWIWGRKPGHATVIVHVDDMQAYHDIEVVEPFNPFPDAVDDPKKGPNFKVVVKTPPPDGDEADEQGGDTGSDNGNSQSGDAEEDSDGSGSIKIGGVSVDSDDENDQEDDLGFKKVGHEHASVDTPDTPISPDVGDAHPDDAEDESDDLDSVEIGGVSADSDDEGDSEDMLGFKKVGHKHESDNKGGLDLFGVSTDQNATALTDPYDLTGTWYLVNNYYACENPGATHIPPAWAQKSAVVRIEPRKDRYVGKVVRNGVLPGMESGMALQFWGPRLDQGEEVLWVERSEKDIYEGQITIDDGRSPQRIRGRKAPVIIKTMKEGGALIGLNPGSTVLHCTKEKLQEIHRPDQLRQKSFTLTDFGRGFRASSQKNPGQYKRDRKSGSINLFNTEVGD